MPPSPSRRPSPGRELIVESTHKRGHSLGSGIPLKSKDDDLVLFNEMQNHERDNFLLHSTEDFEDSISKLKCFSEFKIRLNIPPTGESSDLLHGDREKNDYDWLLTPPDTPLFPSLDDDESQPVNISRGRSRSQPVSISRSSMNERIPRTNRSSASPHRLSQSPRSSYSTSQSIPRTSSTPRSSPPPARAASPSRRPSPPTTKPSTPTPRSSTPTMRRMSTGSSGPAITSSLMGTSPVKANRGNSASPKFQRWQSDLPGFSTEAPPNLRTSLSDRSSSQARGLSPASGSGKDSSSKFRRQSISPSASRSGSSLHCRERDSFSSYSKASKASSGDDDADSVQSVTAGISDNSYVKKYDALANSIPIAVSNRPSRKQTSGSAPKRSFDSVVRQMDQRKAPHNMFRPLLSSVPASTFYVGKANISQRPMFSRNSSLTTSSNASSDHGASFAPDVEDSDLDQSDLNGEWEKTKYTETQEEVFVFDKLDDINEDTGNDSQGERLHSGISNSHENVTEQVDSQEIEKFAGEFALNAKPSQSSYATEISEIECSKTVVLCSKCGKDYFITNANQKKSICEECAAVEQLANRLESRLASDFTQNREELGMKLDLNKELLQQPEKSSEVTYNQYERSRDPDTDFGPAAPIQLLMDSMDHCCTDQKNDSLDKVDDLEANDGFESQQLSTTPGLRIDNFEGTGISVLLTQSSSSSKWPVVRGKVFSAANLLCTEPSYARDNTGAFRRSFGRDTSSASSSVDLGSSKASDSRMLRQFSTKSVEIVNMRNSSDIHTEAISSLSDTSTIAGELCSDIKIESRKFQSCDFGYMENGGIQERLFDQKHVSSYQEADVGDSEHVVDENKDAGSGASIVLSDFDMQLVNQPLGHQFHDTSADNFHKEDCCSCERSSANICHNPEGVPSEIKITSPTPDSLITKDNHMIHYAGVRDEVSDAATRSSSMMIAEHQSNDEGTRDVKIEFTFVEKPDSIEDPEECCSFSSNKDPSISSLDSKVAESPPCEETSATIEAPKDLQRSFTLQEATDTILFCSSIVHDIAYKAATIGMGWELKPDEAPRPTITLPRNSVSNQMDLRRGQNRRTPISPKVKKKKLEIGTKIPQPFEPENNVQNTQVAPSKAATPNTGVMHMVDTAKPPKLESRCNCTVM